MFCNATVLPEYKLSDPAVNNNRRTNVFGKMSQYYTSEQVSYLTQISWIVVEKVGRVMRRRITALQ